MANGFQGPPAVDFYSQLSGLGDTLQANAVLRQRQQLQAARQGAFSDFTALDPNSPDYGRQSLSIAQKLGAAGDQEGAVKFLTLAQQSADRQHQYQREGVSDQHWAITDRRAASADARAAAAESRNAADYENTPDQYAPNPRAAEPGQPKFIDQYAEAKGGGEMAAANQRASIAGQYGIQQGTPEFKTFVLTGKLPDSVTNGGQPEVGLNPAYGTTANGEVGAIQFGKNGKAVQTQLPEGFKLSREPIKMDLGTHIQMYDPITRQPIGNPIPKNIAGAEAAKEEGSAQGLAKVNLPQTLATSEQILKTIQQVQDHPGKQYGLGLWSKAPTIPGTPQADFRAAAGQLTGQTFLQAYQTLRGGGAITDIEGAKATAALARMDQAQSEKAYDEALNEFKQVVKTGMDRAKAKAGGTNAAPAVIDYKTYFGN